MQCDEPNDAHGMGIRTSRNKKKIESEFKSLVTSRSYIIYFLLIVVIHKEDNIATKRHTKIVLLVFILLHDS